MSHVLTLLLCIAEGKRLTCVEPTVYIVYSVLLTHILYNIVQTCVRVCVTCVLNYDNMVVDPNPCQLNGQFNVRVYARVSRTQVVRR